MVCVTEIDLPWFTVQHGSMMSMDLDSAAPVIPSCREPQLLNRQLHESQKCSQMEPKEVCHAKQAVTCCIGPNVFAELYT